MHSLSHSYVDVLKVELSGNEWEFLSHSYQNLSNVGQLILHLHTDANNFEPYTSPNASTALAVTALIAGMIEPMGLRVYHREFSFKGNGSAYYYFIHRNWTEWDRSKSGMMTYFQPQDDYDLKLEHRDDLYYVSQFRERDKIVWKIYNLHLMAANPDYPCLHVLPL